MNQNEQKILVANTAIDTLIKEGKIFSGMKIGLGTGSTAMPAVKRLAEHLEKGTIKDVKAVVTSFQTANACQEWGIPVYSLNDKIIDGQLDLAIDGADEVDPDCNCIKGGGAALLQEKMVEYNSKIFVVIADSSKSVQTIGTGFRVPVEIIGAARIPVVKALNALIEGIRTYDAVNLEAEQYGVMAEVEAIKTDILNVLDVKYGIDEATARELLQNEDEISYTKSLNHIIMGNCSDLVSNL